MTALIFITPSLHFFCPMHRKAAMPPKRSQKKPSSRMRGKKNKTTSGIPEVAHSLPGDTEPQNNNQPPNTIDKLAIEIINHSAPANNAPATPALTECSNTPGPSSMSPQQDSLLPLTGLADLLDRVFTG